MNEEMLQFIGMILVSLVIPFVGGVYLILAFSQEDYAERKSNNSVGRYYFEDDYMPFDVESVSVNEWINYLKMRDENGRISIKEWLEQCRANDERGRSI